MAASPGDGWLDKIYSWMDNILSLSEGQAGSPLSLQLQEPDGFPDSPWLSVDGDGSVAALDVGEGYMAAGRAGSPGVRKVGGSPKGSGAMMFQGAGSSAHNPITLPDGEPHAV